MLPDGGFAGLLKIESRSAGLRAPASSSLSLVCHAISESMIMHARPGYRKEHVAVWTAVHRDSRLPEEIAGARDPIFSIQLVQFSRQ